MSVMLNISATSIRLLSVRGRRIRRWGSVPLAPGLVEDGLILEPKMVGAAIDALFRLTKISKKHVITSLTGLPFTYRILDLPRMKPALLEEAIFRGAKKEIPLPLDELYLSWQINDSNNDQLDVFVLGVSRNIVDTVVETLAEAGVKPYLMDLKPLALARAAHRGNALIVALEPDCFDIVLVANGSPVIMHTITPRGEWASLEDNIQRLTEELSKVVTLYNSSHPEELLALDTPLLLTGEMAVDTAAGELIQAAVKYPVEPLVPQLKYPPYLPVDVFVTNMGLALKEVPQKTVSQEGITRFRDINLNILSGKSKVESPPPVPLRYKLLPLALIIAIGLLFPMYHIKGQVDAETTLLQAELSRMDQELAQAHHASNEIKRIQNTIDIITTDTKTLVQEHQSILNKGDYFVDYLRLVTDILPPQVYITFIEIDADQIIIEGESDSSFTVISYATALESLDRFSEVRIAEVDESASAYFRFVINKQD